MLSWRAHGWFTALGVALLASACMGGPEEEEGWPLSEIETPELALVTSELDVDEGEPVEDALAGDASASSGMVGEGLNGEGGIAATSDPGPGSAAGSGRTSVPSAHGHVRHRTAGSADSPVERGLRGRPFPPAGPHSWSVHERVGCGIQPAFDRNARGRCGYRGQCARHRHQGCDRLHQPRHQPRVG